MKTVLKNFTLTIITLLLLVSPGLAQKGNVGDFKQVIDLEPTATGKRLETEGQAVIGQRNGTQFFGVRLRANMKDGTLLTVAVTTSSGDLIAGTITIFLGTGQLLIENSPNTLSPDIFPVQDIQDVFVLDAKDVLLEGSF